MGRRAILPSLIFVICSSVYVGTLGSRIRGTSKDAHFVYLAESFLHRQLSVVGNRPLGNNDWTLYQGKWYVSFPPVPALILVPAVSVWHYRVWDRLFWAIFAGLGPAFLYLLLRFLRETGKSVRKPYEDLTLTALFSFGSVYYFVSVQGSTWYAAHVVCCSLLALYLMWSFDARRPLLAGIMLGLCFLTRPSTILVGAFFVIEALRKSRKVTNTDHEIGSNPSGSLLQFLSTVQWKVAVGRIAIFTLPIMCAVGTMMWMNYLRFDDPFVSGYEYLQIKWRYRIDKWSLFNYHYLSKNLAVFLASLPWISSTAPFIKISRHGLALWVTTPHVILTLWPRRMSISMIGLYLSVGMVALLDLCYQNSGWVQFGYRFSLDYMVLLFVLLSLGQRRYRIGFYTLMLFALLINLFGAVTFDRMNQFYDNDPTQRIIFQPD